MTETLSYAHNIAGQLNLRQQQVGNTLELLGDGGTVPFIARYRKELTGSLDEVVVATIRELHQKLMEVDKRRQSIVETLTKIGLLDDSPEAAAAQGGEPHRARRHLPAVSPETQNPGPYGQRTGA